MFWYDIPVAGGPGRAAAAEEPDGGGAEPAGGGGGNEDVEEERVIGFEVEAELELGGGGPTGDFDGCRGGGGGVALVRDEGTRLTAAAKTPVAVAGVVAVVLCAMMPVEYGRFGVRFGRELFAAPSGACVGVDPPMSLRTIQAVSGRSLK